MGMEELIYIKLLLVTVVRHLLFSMVPIICLCLQVLILYHLLDRYFLLADISLFNNLTSFLSISSLLGNIGFGISVLILANDI